MEPFWKGAFVKHRLYTGDISNHIEIKSVEIDGDWSSGWIAHVIAGFLGSTEEFEYELEVDGPDQTDSELITAIVHYHAIHHP